MFYVTDTITGILDEEASFETEAEAQAFIDKLEEADKEKGRYTEGFYAIIEDDLEGEDY